MSRGPDSQRVSWMTERNCHDGDGRVRFPVGFPVSFNKDTNAIGSGCHPCGICYFSYSFRSWRFEFHWSLGSTDEFGGEHSSSPQQASSTWVSISGSKALWKWKPAVCFLVRSGFSLHSMELCLRVICVVAWVPCQWFICLFKQRSILVC